MCESASFHSLFLNFIITLRIFYITFALVNKYEYADIIQKSNQLKNLTTVNSQL